MSSPEIQCKRKKYYSKSEILQKLKENDDKVSEVVKEVCEELSPFDVNDEEALLLEDRLERLEKTSKKFAAKIYKLKKEFKDRKYRKEPEKLEEKLISCSQASVLQSDDSQSLCGGSQDVDCQMEVAMDGDPKSRSSSYIKKPLNHQLAQNTRRHRVSEKRKTFQFWAAEEGVTTTELLGYFLHLENYNRDRSLAGLGWSIFTGGKLFEKTEVSLDEAVWMIERAKLSQSIYLEIRLRFLDRIVFPSLVRVREDNKLHRPALTEYRNGVKASLTECIKLTLQERLQCMAPMIKVARIDEQTMKISFTFTWGLDGSGDHSNYHQLSKVDFTTKQVMSVCFALRNIQIEDAAGRKFRWDSKVEGHNKPQNVRPLSLYPAKESKELLEDFIPKVEAEISELKSKGVDLMIFGQVTNAKCDKAKLSMADGKMVTTLLQLGGAYCTMCTKDMKECHKVDVIENGFVIDRSVETVKELALSLTDPDTGEVVRKKADYKTRQGVCDQPITESDITKNIPVCHAKIRSFEFVIELLTRELSHQKWSHPSKPVTYTAEEKQNYKEAREKIKEDLYKNLAINIGNAGDMVTGAAFQTFSSDSARAFICSLVKENIQEDLNLILLGLCAAVKIINSQKRKVNVEKLRKLVMEVNRKIVQLFPWAIVSPSVHRILAHCWEVILLNDGYGLGGESEEGLEALNKYIRERREHGSRKDSTENNFTDTYNHLWDRSRPKIIEMERKIKSRKPKILIATEIEALVESLFLEDE